MKLITRRKIMKMKMKKNEEKNDTKNQSIFE